MNDKAPPDPPRPKSIVPRPADLDAALDASEYAAELTGPLLGFDAVPRSPDDGGSSPGLREQEGLEEWVARAEWLEEEAAQQEGEARTDTLLQVSELWALAGNLAYAREVAERAAALDGPISQRQCRQLALADQDLPAVRDWLIAEVADLEGDLSDNAEQAVSSTPTPEQVSHKSQAQVEERLAHACFFLAELERLEGSGSTEGQKHMDRAAQLKPGDARPPLYRLARQLVASAAPPSLHWPTNSELQALAMATETLRRARDVDTRGAIAQEPVTGLLTAQHSLQHGQVDSAALALRPLFDDPSLGCASRWLAALLLALNGETRNEAIRIFEGLRAADPRRRVPRPLLFTRLEAAGDDATRRQLLASEEAEALSRDERLVASALLCDDAAVSSAAAVNAQPPWSPQWFDLRWAILVTRGQATDAELVAASPEQAELILWSTLSGTGLRGADELQAASERLIELEQYLPEDPLLRCLLVDHVARTGEDQDLARELLKFQKDQRELPLTWTCALLLETAGQREQALALYREIPSAHELGEAGLRACHDLDPSLSRDERGRQLERLAQDCTGERADYLRCEAMLLRVVAALGGERGGTAPSDEDLRQHLERSRQLSQDRLAQSVLDLLGELHALSSDQNATAAHSIERQLDGAPKSTRAMLIARRALLLDEGDKRRKELNRALDLLPGHLDLWQLRWQESLPSVQELGETWERLATQLSEHRAALYLTAAWFYEVAGSRSNAARLAQRSEKLEPGPFSGACFERTALGSELQAELRERWVSELSTSSSAPQKAWLAQALARLDEARGESERQREWLWEGVEAQPDQLSSLIALEQFALEHNHREILARIEPQLAKNLPAEAAAPHIELAARICRRQKGWPAAFSLLKELSTEQLSPLALRQLHAMARRESDAEVTVVCCVALSCHTGNNVDRAVLLLEAARACVALKQPAYALELIEESARLAPGQLLVQDLRASLLLESGDYSAAATAKEQVAQLSCVAAHQASAWYEAACIWLDHADQRGFGQAALEKACELDASNADAFARLLSLLRTNKPETASRLVQRRLATAPTAAERTRLSVVEAQLLADTGNPQKALKHLQQVLLDHPAHQEALDSILEIALNSKDARASEEALLPLARRSNLSASNAVRLYLTLARISLMETQLEQAERYYREVLDLETANPDALQALPEIYRRLKQPEKLVEVLERQVADAERETSRHEATLQLARTLLDPGKEFGKDFDGSGERAAKIVSAGLARWPHDAALLELGTRYAGEKPDLADALRKHADSLLRQTRQRGPSHATMDALALLARASGRMEWVPCLEAISALIRTGEGRFEARPEWALDPRCLAPLAPRSISPELRQLLHQAGSMLDSAFPSVVALHRHAPDRLRAVAERVHELSKRFGLPGAQLECSGAAPNACVVIQDQPARILLGSQLLDAATDEELEFLIWRCLSLAEARAGLLTRLDDAQALEAVMGLVYALAPELLNGPHTSADKDGVEWVKQRVQPLLPQPVPTATSKLAKAVLDQFVRLPPHLATDARAWANRTALLATGNLGAACRALCRLSGGEFGVTVLERQEQITRTPELADLSELIATREFSELLRELTKKRQPN